jgi:hypothetical protein
MQLLQLVWQEFNIPLALSAASTSILLADGPTYPGSSEIAVLSLDVAKAVVIDVDVGEPELHSLTML